MSQTKHSLMAERVAITRAVHQLVDGQPLVFPDPLALPILGAEGARLARDEAAGATEEGMRRARGMICIRSRFTEDELEAAVAAGTTQYVVLGAGLDTFAYRRADLAPRLTIFEVDQPATQRWKVRRLAEAGIAQPPNLRLVAVDFNERTLADGLAAAGFRRDEPAFFSWLGVVYYLPRDSILATLRYVAEQAAASQVIFDFAVAEAGIPPQYLHLFRAFNAYNRTASERWQTWFLPAEIRGELDTLGFTRVLHLDAPLAAARYLQGRSDQLLTGPLIGLVSASRAARR